MFFSGVFKILSCSLNHKQQIALQMYIYCIYHHSTFKKSQVVRLILERFSICMCTFVGMRGATWTSNVNRYMYSHCLWNNSLTLMKPDAHSTSIYPLLYLSIAVWYMLVNVQKLKLSINEYKFIKFLNLSLTRQCWSCCLVEWP